MPTVPMLMKFYEGFHALRPKGKKLFLAGHVTFSEAQQFSAFSKPEKKRAKTQLHQMHLRRHSPILREHENIGEPVESIYAFGEELDAMPVHISHQVLEGSMTLIQARFAKQRQFGKKPVMELCRANVPKVPNRDRMRPASSEVSVHAVNVRVRPSLPSPRR